MSLCLSACLGKSGPEELGPTPQVTEWQASLLGQEGHGGDAIVCFNIPIAQALVQIDLRTDTNCQDAGDCPDVVSSPRGDGPAPQAEFTWKMTEEGRQSIRSAMPLEQYLAERIPGRRDFLDRLKKMPVEEGYHTLIAPFRKLPGAFSRIEEQHRKLGWLERDGIASEFGLQDVNDSGFVSENEIDTKHCQELQAVVRRDNQLWYDEEIVQHFDNAGKVIIQAHEEIYTWGKWLDQINDRLDPAHATSTKTRRLILKLLDDSLGFESLNEQLKSLSFSAFYWENTFRLPISPGYYMDEQTCLEEQGYLGQYLRDNYSVNYLFDAQNIMQERYLMVGEGDSSIELRHNYPDPLANLIVFTMNFTGSDDNFRQAVLGPLGKLENIESCRP